MPLNSQIRQLQNPSKTTDIYPLTVEEAVFDDDGVQLPSKLNSVQNQLNDHTGVLGAKNLLPMPWTGVDCKDVGIEKTKNGIAFIVNEDYSITLLSGTATANTWIIPISVAHGVAPLVEGENYVLSGASGPYPLYITDANLAVKASVTAVNKEWRFVGFSGNISLNINIPNGVTISEPQTYKPMIRLASDPDPAYVPYAMTNRELTEKINLFTPFSTVYGFRINNNESDPATMVTYCEDAVGMTPAHMDYSTGVFDYGDWEDAFFMPRPCMLTSAGTVDYYLNPNDYTLKEDGTASDIANTSYDGNAMMEWGQNGKKIWAKIVPSSDGKSATIYIADYKADEGFTDYPFHGADGESKAHFYTPIYNGSVIDSKMRSLSGQAVSNKLTAGGERTAAQANGTRWDIETFGARQLINFLLILMAKTTDTQTAYGQGLSKGGNEANNNNFRTGVHNTKGLFYGTNSGTETSSDFTNAVKIFGMENWYGFQWRRLVGWICAKGVQKVKLGYGTADGSTVSDYNLTGDGYIALGATPSGTSGGYISEMSFSNKAMLPKVASGTASTKYTDGLWLNFAIVAVAHVGGSSNNGLPVGALYSDLGDAASGASWSYGAALSYV